MYINSEKDLENYICNNITGFISNIKSEIHEYRDKEIKFLGRQIRIGGQVADLVFYYDSNIKLDEFIETELLERTFIIVELKYRVCETKDVAQLSKYINLFNELEYKECCKDLVCQTRGILIGFDLDENTQEIEMMLNSINENKIEFMKINTQCTFSRIAYSHVDEYIENLEIDKRISNLCKEVAVKEDGNI